VLFYIIFIQILIYFVDIKRILESIWYYLFNLCTQKKYWIYWVFLLIVVDTERIMYVLGIIYLFYVHKKNIGYIGYFY